MNTFGIVKLTVREWTQ